MKKIVVLNSGGFDSCIMIKMLKEDYNAELHSLYFSYGQSNDSLAQEKAKEIADKYCVSHRVISIPEISWTKSEFFTNEYNSFESRYLEARNFIFTSYAVSLAQSIKADSVAMALIADGIDLYPDTSLKFAKKMDKLCREFGVMFKTPLIDKYKIGLFDVAIAFGMTENDFISCDVPVDNKPCGVCPDCKAIELFKDKRIQYKH